MGKENKKKAALCLAAGIIGAVCGLFFVVAFQQKFLMQLSLLARMAASIFVYWAIALVPLGVMVIAGDKPGDYGFRKEGMPSQMLWGLAVGGILSFVLTLLPHLLGYGEWVNNGRYYQYFWQFVYEFSYTVLAVGAVEEFVFRGFVYSKVKALGNSETMAVIVSSLLFGLFHFLSGNILQIILTGCLGAFLCICRLKIKHCSTLSLIIAHGVYDGLISVWNSFL